MTSALACNSVPTEQGGNVIIVFNPSGETRAHCAMVLPRPSLVTVKTPGAASASFVILPAVSKPLLLIVKSTLSPLATTCGRTRLICPGETKISRAATPLTATVTPPRSKGILVLGAPAVLLANCAPKTATREPRAIWSVLKLAALAIAAPTLLLPVTGRTTAWNRSSTDEAFVASRLAWKLNVTELPLLSTYGCPMVSCSSAEPALSEKVS